MNKITIRRAEQRDIPFLARMVILAETTGSELNSYRLMFRDLSEEELISGIERALRNDQPGHALSVETFLIAEVDGIPAGTVSGYIEGSNGNSNHLMTGALMDAFGTEAVLNGLKSNRWQKETHIPKTVGALQIDSVATLPAFRGKGLFTSIFEEHCKTMRSASCDMAEIQAWIGNTNAISLYLKIGFTIATERVVGLPEGKTGGRILIQKKI